nr:hypothetical protein Iba_chr13bCG4730 [Ipomoea batatas]
MNSHDCLLFNRRIPPWILHKHIGGCCEIQAHAPSFQRHKQNHFLSSLTELMQNLFSLFLLGFSIKS